MKHKFNYKWYLKDGYPAPGIKKNGLKVFSCFSCGGGSTMGYKLAGYDVIGFNEIDPKMAECYIENHNPKHRYIEPIQDFKNRDDLPEELFNLDILDGSPPCSSFSMAGNREKDWGKKKKFREGQQEQVLDTLFFDFLDVAKKLKPKVVLCENVKGLLLGNASEYFGAVMERFNQIGYNVGYRLLDASKMGVPQKRERVFIYAIRNDLLSNIETCDLFGFEPKLNLDFHEPKIKFGKVRIDDYENKELSDRDYNIWIKRKLGDNDFCDIFKREFNKESNWNTKLIYDYKICNTITSTEGSKLILFSDPRYISDHEFHLIGSYPIDYNHLKNKPRYLIGMSVPPVMTAQIANRIYEQWFTKFKKEN